MKKSERYLHLTDMFLSGHTITVESYMKKYDLKMKTAQRDIHEYQQAAYNTIGLIIKVEHKNDGWRYQALNTIDVLDEYN